MASITINANRSVHIDAIDPNVNKDGSPQIDVGESAISSERRRALIGFDLTTVSGSTINSVDLKVYDQAASSLTSNTRTMRVYRLKRAWVENQATWNVYSTGNSWSTAGAGDTNDRDTTESGSQSMASPPVSGYKTISLTVANFQAIADGTFTNNGLVLIMDTETNDMHRFDGSTDGNPPQLVIDYTPRGGALFYSQL